MSCSELGKTKPRIERSNDGDRSMINGLYQAIITLPGDVTNCVVALDSDKGILQGGDSITCFAGEFTIDGDKFTAHLTTRKYADLGGYQPIFGPKPAKVSVSGNVTNHESMIGEATSPSLPGVRAKVELRYLQF
jgi:hypothetical protein